MIVKTPFKVERGFSPNGDNVNDLFELPGIEEIPNSKITVFTRQGIIVYENKDYKSEWDGTDMKGTALPPGTYYYVLELGNGETIKGFVVIEREK